MKCSTCGWQDLVTLPFAQADRCPTCSPKGSAAQHEIADWLESSFGINVGRNIVGVIGKHELDIYVPEHALAIELNGLYWHNEDAGRDCTYHQNKTMACKAIGVNLIHVFEDEWRFKREIVKSMITAQMRRTPNNVHVRECNVVELSRAQKKAFFTQNHIDGDVPSTAAWGLADRNGTVLCAISVRNPIHRACSNKLDIVRFCSRVHYNIPGGMNALVKAVKECAVKEGFTSITAHFDTRHGGDGKGYVDEGFNCVKKLPPSFWWTDCHARFNRSRFHDGDQGVTKIWGCENLVYELDVRSGQAPA